MKLSVIGCGYLGATHAACMAELGHDVLGVETDPAKLAALQAGEVPFHEPRLADVLRGHVKDGSLRFTDDFAEAGAHGLFQRVHAHLVRFDHPLAHVTGATNAVVAEGNFVGRLLFQGAGAGEEINERE